MHPNRAAGFTLIEVLVTVVVVSIGLLAVAGLQVISKKANYDAVQRSTAAALGQGIIERIRANPAEGAVYAPAGGTALSEAQAPSAVSCNPSPNAALGATAGPACTADQVARADLYAWWQDLLGAAEAVPAAGTTAADTNLGGLQHPNACITLTRCGTLDVYLVAIAWRGLTPVAAAGTDSLDPSANACGSSDANYQPPSTVAASLTMRRVLVLQAAVLNTSVAAGPAC